MGKSNSKINLLYLSIVALNLASVFLPTSNHQTLATGGTTTCRMWIDHGNAGNWHSSKNYAVVTYSDGTVLGAPNSPEALMTFDNANQKWYLDVPSRPVSVKFYFDVNGNGYSASDKRDLVTGDITVPDPPCGSCVLATNQYSSGAPLTFNPFVAVPTDKSYIHDAHFESHLNTATTGPGGTQVSTLCSNPGLYVSNLLAYYNALPTYEQDEFLETTVSVYPSPTTMTGAEIIAYLTAYAAANPELVAFQVLDENQDRNKAIAASMVIIGTIVTAGFFFISKRRVLN
ncbi:MAG: hypothetical protein ACOX3K_04655 [Bacilli bacterium]|jgi:hypothetical protein